MYGKWDCPIESYLALSLAGKSEFPSRETDWFCLIIFWIENNVKKMYSWQLLPPVVRNRTKVIQTHLSIHLWPTCWRFVTAGVQVEVLVFLPGIACSAAALRSAFPPWESALPADWEEGWGCSRERYCNKCGRVMKALSFKLLCNTHKSPWDVLKRENRVWYLLCIIFLFCYGKKKIILLFVFTWCTRASNWRGTSFVPLTMDS